MRRGKPYSSLVIVVAFAASGYLPAKAAAETTEAFDNAITKAEPESTVLGPGDNLSLKLTWDLHQLPVLNAEGALDPQSKILSQNVLVQPETEATDNQICVTKASLGSVQSVGFFMDILGVLTQAGLRSIPVVNGLMLAHDLWGAFTDHSAASPQDPPHVSKDTNAKTVQSVALAVGSFLVPQAESIVDLAQEAVKCLPFKARDRSFVP